MTALSVRSQIRQLNDATVSRIAAGEVIERPVSVVKELVENSLDAGSTRIDVAIEHGGIKLLSVSDNGCGIPPDEVPLAFERFATSKITSDKDVEQVTTLGFRGEALPSIASVASLEMATRVPGGQGVRYRVEYGKAGGVEPAGVPEGTAVAVRELFRMTPARYKFLSSVNYEALRVQQLLTAMALVHPGVKFSLTVDGAKRLSSPGNGNLRDTMAALYGAAIADAMLDLPQDEGELYSVSGLVGPPGIKRRNRNFMTVSVNRRLISNRRVAIVLAKAYREYFGEGEFPVAAVDLTVPRAEADVNIHPAKTDIRFSREDLVLSLLQRTVRQVLLEQAPVPEVKRFAAGSTGVPTEGVHPTEDRLRDGRPQSALSSSPANSQTAKSASPVAGTEHTALPTHKEVLSSLRFVGQVQQTYLVAEGNGGVYLIDQHAASERVTYERIKEAMAKREVESQQLLTPELVTLAPGLEAMLSDCEAELRSAGFQFDHYGDGSVALRAVPAIMAARRTEGPKQVFTSVLDDINNLRKSTDWQERVLATIACHSSVRAGQKLEEKSAIRLIRDLQKLEHSQTCPHGRPTMLTLSSMELAREFGRT